MPVVPVAMKKVLQWLQRSTLGDGELAAKTKDLQETLDKRTLEHERQLNEMRLERDTATMELETIQGWMSDVTKAIDQDVPSILEQTPWPCGFYDFGKAMAPNVRFFNCSVIDRFDGRWLIARRSREVAGSKLGMNDIAAFRLDNNAPAVWTLIKPMPRYKDEHFEDPRVFWLGDKMHVSATSFQFFPNKKWTGCHQVIFPVNNDWTVPRIYDPEHGRNGAGLYFNTGDEKNWLWFQNDGKNYCVYTTKPHQVVEWDRNFKKVAVHDSKEFNAMWTFGEPRGGTPPIRVGDEFISFFHSSTPWVGFKRRYHMGAYAFEAKPPFRITRMSSIPILSGSKSDPWVEGLPLVVFPCGAILKDGVWKIVLGVNDCACAWIDIPHDDLIQTLRKTYVAVQKEEIASKAPGADSTAVADVH